MNIKINKFIQKFNNNIIIFKRFKLILLIYNPLIKIFFYLILIFKFIKIFNINFLNIVDIFILTLILGIYYLENINFYFNILLSLHYNIKNYINIILKYNKFILNLSILFEFINNGTSILNLIIYKLDYIIDEININKILTANPNHIKIITNIFNKDLNKIDILLNMVNNDDNKIYNSEEDLEIEQIKLELKNIEYNNFFTDLNNLEREFILKKLCLIYNRDFNIYSNYLYNLAQITDGSKENIENIIKRTFNKMDNQEYSVMLSNKAFFVKYPFLINNINSDPMALSRKISFKNSNYPLNIDNEIDN